MAAQDFSRADGNRDGKVSREELTTCGDNSMSFTSLDKDADGNLSNSAWSRHDRDDEDDMNDE